MARRVFVSLSCVLVLVACTAAPPGVTPLPGATHTPSSQPAPSGATPSSGPTQPAASFATPDPNAAFDPVALARAVVTAGTEAARAQAVVNALAAIGLGIYTAEGDAIVRGAERSDTDFIVYDFEVAGLAAGIADADEVYLEDVAAELATMSVAAGGSAFSAADFATAVTSATAAAMATPDDAAGYALRLARELGVLRATPFDLASSPTDTPITLDPLAAFLVDADFSLPRIAGAEPPPEATLGQLATIAAVGGVAAANPCAAFTRQAGSWHAGMAQVPGASGANASYSRSLQARLLGGSVGIGMGGETDWHHVHAGEPRQAKEYPLALRVRAPLPAGVSCGPIRFSTSGQMLGGGAIVGAEVTWTHPKLEDHADLDCQADCRATNNQGLAVMKVTPLQEPGPGGLGPLFIERIPVTAAVDLFKALGANLFGQLSLPPDMRLFARATKLVDVGWHRGYKVSVQLDSQLYVNKALNFEYRNHVGTANATGVVEADTVHPPGVPSTYPIRIGSILSTTLAGRGPNCAPGVVNVGGVSGPVLGSITYGSDSTDVPFMVVDAVIFPPEAIKLYLDVGPWTDARNVPVRLVQCDPNTGRVVYDNTSPGTNLWEGTIFRSYPRGLDFQGVAMVNGGPTTDTNPYVWNLRASDDDWEGDAEFLLAAYDTPLECDGNCDPANSWLKLNIFVEPLDP